MNGDSIEIRYCGRDVGYVTEHIAAQTTLGAINLIRARVPDATINWINYHPTPPPASRPENGGSTGRRP